MKKENVNSICLLMFNALSERVKRLESLMERDIEDEFYDEVTTGSFKGRFDFDG
jgi:hypothetical protein